MVDVKVELVDGSYHDVDSSEMAFKIAGSMAVKEAARLAHPVLLEPIMDVEVVTPSDYMGEVIGDLSARRGKIGGMTQAGRRACRGRERSPVRDVRLLDHAPLDEPGTRDLQHAVQPLPGSAEIEGGGNCGESERVDLWPKPSLSAISPT